LGLTGAVVIGIKVERSGQLCELAALFVADHLLGKPSGAWKRGWSHDAMRDKRPFLCAAAADRH